MSAAPDKRGGGVPRRLGTSARVVLWSFAVFVLAAAGQASLIVWLPRLLPERGRWYLAIAVLAYWLILAVVFAALIGRQIRDRLENPMRELGEAADRVAHGDFSVYIAPRHVRGERGWDATDRMFADFNMMVAELGSIETMKNDFVANVSHDIRNPLAIIETHARALARPNVPEDRRVAYAKTIAEAAERLNALVSNVLKLNKLESQGIVTQARDYDLPRQLTDAALTLYDLFEAKGVELDVDVEDRASVHADPGILDIVWANVLGNALKYTESGGHVTVCQRTESSSDGSSEITVKIIDDGCGMTETERSHVFDKFYQGDTVHAAEGNGLGMAMVARAVELSGGKVRVSSRRGVGTTVVVTLPTMV